MPMRYLQINFSALLAFTLLAACTGNRHPDPEKTIVSEPPPTAKVIVSASPTPTELTLPGEGITATPSLTPPPTPLASGNTRYTLTAVLNDAQHYLTVDEQIAYTNRSPDSLNDLLLMVEPLYYPGVFHLSSLTWENGETVDGYSWEVGQLRIPLPQALAPGESLGLSLSYELTLPSPVPSADTRPVPFGYTARQTNLVDWYPFIPPYHPGQGWLAHQAGFFGEHLAYEDAIFQVNIRLSDARSDLILAASAPEKIDGDWHRYRLDSARSFAWSVSSQYQVLTTTVGSVTVMGYAFPAHADAGKTALETTAKALALYSRLFGPYPHSQLSVVEADFLDGMEYDGLYFLSYGFYNTYTGTPAEYLVAIAAHETAHQWWYGLVGNDQALEPWLDEALSTYSERLYYENTHPDALQWWWDYRINYYNPQGWVDGSIYNPEGYRAYRDAVYLNGALFLEDLRDLIGDPAFFAFLKDYTEQYAHKLATGRDFFMLLSQHTSADYSVLLKKYFQTDYLSNLNK